MCATCGCSDNNKVTVTNPATGEQTILSHDEAHALGATQDHAHAHGHSHEHHHHYNHEHNHGQAHEHAAVPRQRSDDPQQN